MAEIRMTIFGRSGGRLADIRPTLHSVSWKLNNEGRARFYLPYADSKCTRQNLKPGNYLLMEFENGLPDWSGVIDYPLDRDGQGVTVSAFTGARLLDWRVSRADDHFQGMTAGGIFRQALRTANASRSLNVVENNIYAGGDAITQRWHYYNVLQRVRELARLSYQDFHIGHRVSGGAIQFLGNWYERRGADKSQRVLLAEGANVTSPHLSEQGPVANVVIAVGEGAEWADRPVGTATDADSIAAYGYRQYVEQVPSDSQTTLDTMAQALLAQMAEPRRMISMTVTDNAPARFADYDIGDIVDTYIFTGGGEDWLFEDPVRVIARSWVPNGECELEVAEWVG